MNGPGSTSITSVDLSFRFTRIARHSRVVDSFDDVKHTRYFFPPVLGAILHEVVGVLGPFWAIIFPIEPSLPSRASILSLGIVRGQPAEANSLYLGGRLATMLPEQFTYAPQIDLSITNL